MENFDFNQLIDLLMNTIQNEYKNLNTLNIMILGKTGSGKSTLVNGVFGQRVAATGIGRPETEKINSYKIPGKPLKIYDTPGLELGGKNSVDSLLEQVVDLIDKGRKSGDLNNNIHCIWYCINTLSNRFEPTEREFIEKLLEATRKYEGEVPVILVLTQSFVKKNAKNLKAEIEKENLPINERIVLVLAEDYPIDDECIVKAYGLDVLAEVTNNAVPEAIKKTFVSLQKANLELKTNKAHAAVAASAVAATATGAAPIPFSDAALLVPVQIGMLARITTIYGLPIEKATMTAIVSSLIGTAGTTIVGKTVVSNLLKMIPGVGSVAGGVISGATAGVLTTALGEAYIAIMCLICNGELKMSDLSTEVGKEKIRQIFAGKLKGQKE